MEKKLKLPLIGISKTCIAPPPRSVTEAWLITILIVIAMTAMSLRPIGFLGGGHDDIQYINAATKWVTNFPYIGVTHWELRHPFVLQIAPMIIGGAGASRHLLFIPVAYYCLSLILGYLIVRRMAGAYAAFFACTLFATSPAVIDAATSLMPDLVEFFFVLAALSIVLLASQRRLPTAAFILCGILVGLSWLTRQTSGAAILFLAGTFLFQPMFSRRDYLVIAASAFLVFALETVWLGVTTGDFLYRLHTDVRHVAIPSEHFTGGVANPGENPILNSHIITQWVPSSPVETNWFLDPYVAFFTSRHYGLLFYALIPATVYFFRRGTPGGALTMVRAFSWIGILWFVFATYVIAVRPQARYFIPIVFSACAIVGIYLAALWSENKRAMLLVAFSAVVLVNILACDLQQYRNYSADAIVDYAAKSSQPIIISEAVSKSINLGAIDPQLIGRVSSRPPMIGDILLIGPRDRAIQSKYQLCDDDALKVYEPRPYLINTVIHAIGLDGVFPGSLLRRMQRPDGVVSIGRRCI